MAGLSMRKLSLMCRHANHLPQDTVTRFRWLMPCYYGKNTGNLVPMPIIRFSVKIIAKAVLKG